MTKIKTLIHLLIHPSQMIIFLASNSLMNWLPDAIYLKLMYWANSGKKLNLKKPVAFTEKMQWLKLHDRQEKYIDYVDKIRVKEYVGRKIGQQFVLPTLGVWDSFDQIDFDSLPDRFVLKCNHDSGSIVKCKGKATFDFTEAEKKITRRLHTDAYNWGREWPYKQVKRKVFAEAYLTQNEESDELIDYKFYCFDGKPEYCQVITDRAKDERIDFFDMEWRHQPFVGLTPVIGNSTHALTCPVNYSKMQEFATILSKGTPFCRIDFYEAEEKLYFGEITLYPAAGFGRFTPDEWDIILGEKIKLDNIQDKTAK